MDSCSIPANYTQISIILPQRSDGIVAPDMTNYRQYHSSDPGAGIG